MRLIYYCPLTARIGHHLREFVRFKSHGAYRKYHYFISEFFNKKGREVAIFWEGQKKTDLYGYLKCIAWMIINGIKPWKIKVFEKLEELDPQKDVLLAFPFLSFNHWSLHPSSAFIQYSGIRVCHLSHYFSDTEKVCSVIRNLPHTVMVGESNLQKNPLFQRYMKHHPFYILPFVLKTRYQSFVEFHQRKAKCLAAGTKSKICPNLHKEFFELFKSKYLHALRGEIFDKKTEIQDYIESLIFDFQEAEDFIPKNSYEKLIRAITKKIGNDRRRFFSFDIVQKYNEYQMFVSPEEESGAPSISFIEGMACGCAYFGRAMFYVDLGMIPDIHFITYDGTLEDLVQRIKFYQSHPAITARIAENGRQFVQKNLQPQLVAEKFWCFLEHTVKASHANRN